MLLAALAVSAAFAAQDTSCGLVFEPSSVGGPPNLLDRLSAEIRGRKVTSLTVSPYGAGD